MTKKLVIALDNMSKQEAKDFVLEVSNSIKSDQLVYKINDLIALIWFEWLKELFNDVDAFFMLDPKFHDIWNTVINYLKQLKNSGFAPKVKFLTVHSSNWEIALKKVMQAKKDLALENIKILAITALTSLDSWETSSIYETNSKDSVLKLANIAYKAWVDWVVCSAHESKIIKEIFWEDFITMTPWIRLEQIEGDDQQRVKTPKEAIQNWSDNLVIWRPITQSENKIKTIKNILPHLASPYRRGIIWKNHLQKLFYTWTWEEILKYIWVIYLRPENWKYCKLASWLYSNAYINIWILERYPRILQKIAFELREKLIQKWVFDEEKLDDYVIMWAQMWSVRISSHLSNAMWIYWKSIYTEKDWDDMKLKRHNIDLKWKKVILSEDIISAGSTIKKMTALVESLWGKVVSVTCFGNRNWWEEFAWIPLIYCYKPPVFELYYDENTPIENRKNYPKLPQNSQIAIKPKNEWNDLVESMR